MHDDDDTPAFDLTITLDGKWRLSLDHEAYIDFDSMVDAKRQQTELRRRLADRRKQQAEADRAN